MKEFAEFLRKEGFDIPDKHKSDKSPWRHGAKTPKPHATRYREALYYFLGGKPGDYGKIVEKLDQAPTDSDVSPSKEKQAEREGSLGKQEAKQVASAQQVQARVTVLAKDVTDLPGKDVEELYDTYQKGTVKKVVETYDTAKNEDLVYGEWAASHSEAASLPDRHIREQDSHKKVAFGKLEVYDRATSQDKDLSGGQEYLDLDPDFEMTDDELIYGEWPDSDDFTD